MFPCGQQDKKSSDYASKTPKLVEWAICKVDLCCLRTQNTKHGTGVMRVYSLLPFGSTEQRRLFFYFSFLAETRSLAVVMLHCIGGGCFSIIFCRNFCSSFDPFCLFFFGPIASVFIVDDDETATAVAVVE